MWNAKIYKNSQPQQQSLRAGNEAAGGLDSSLPEIGYFQQRFIIIKNAQINQILADYDARAFDDYTQVIKIVERWIYSTV